MRKHEIIDFYIFLLVDLWHNHNDIFTLSIHILVRVDFINQQDARIALHSANITVHFRIDVYIEQAFDDCDDYRISKFFLKKLKFKILSMRLKFLTIKDLYLYHDI